MLELMLLLSLGYCLRYEEQAVAKFGGVGGVLASSRARTVLSKSHSRRKSLLSKSQSQFLDTFEAGRWRLGLGFVCGVAGVWDCVPVL